MWLDNEIITGDRWEYMIRHKIDTCSAFVVLMSPAAETSDWVTRQIHRAETRGRPILPLLLRGEVFFRLNNIHFEDVGNTRMPSIAFVDRLRALTDEPEAPAPMPPTDNAITSALASITAATEVLRVLGPATGEDAAFTLGGAQAVSRLVRDFALAEVRRIAGHLSSWEASTT